MEVDTSYNILIRQRMLNKLEVVVSDQQMAMKFSYCDNLTIIIVKVD